MSASVMCRWVWSCPVALVLSASSAFAHDPAHPPYPGWENIKCACRANGQRYDVGQRVCLSTPKGFRVAECQLSQNVTTWAVQTESCDVTAQITVTPIPGWSRPTHGPISSARSG